MLLGPGKTRTYSGGNHVSCLGRIQDLAKEGANLWAPKARRAAGGSWNVGDAISSQTPFPGLLGWIWGQKRAIDWTHRHSPVMLPVRGKTRQHCCAPRGHKKCFWRFSETFFVSRTQNVCRTKMLRARQNESTFEKHDHVSNVAAPKCPRFAGALVLSLFRTQRQYFTALLTTVRFEFSNGYVLISIVRTEPLWGKFAGTDPNDSRTNSDPRSTGICMTSRLLWFRVSGSCTKWRIQASFDSSYSRSLNVKTSPRNSIPSLDTFKYFR